MHGSMLRHRGPSTGAPGDIIIIMHAPGPAGLRAHVGWEQGPGSRNAEGRARVGGRTHAMGKGQRRGMALISSCGACCGDLSDLPRHFSRGGL